MNLHKLRREDLLQHEVTALRFTSGFEKYMFIILPLTFIIRRYAVRPADNHLPAPFTAICFPGNKRNDE
ncbi:hypothetical protein MHB81_18890 [Paenibacillus sp. FSL H7-0326]